MEFERKRFMVTRRRGSVLQKKTNPQYRLRLMKKYAMEQTNPTNVTIEGEQTKNES